MKPFTETIRKHPGWCSQGSYIRPFSRSPERENPVQSSSPSGPFIPSPAGATPPESRSEYQENILLIILLLGGLFYAWDIRGLAIGGIVSAIAVYYDAVTLHRAGQKFEKESFFGDVVAWRPLTWAICARIGSLIILAVYVFSRREIFNANN